MSSPITSAPAAASAAQTACPIPRAAPVTRADLPSRLKFTCGALSPISSDELAVFIFYRKEIPASGRRRSSRHLAPRDEWASRCRHYSASDGSEEGRPLIAANSRARASTISDVTVPIPAAFSIIIPLFSGFFLIIQPAPYSYLA